MIGVTITATKNVDTALFLSISSVFLGVRILQFGLEKDDATALQILPVFRFRNFVGRRNS